MSISINAQFRLWIFYNFVFFGDITSISNTRFQILYAEITPRFLFTLIFERQLNSVFFPLFVIRSYNALLSIISRIFGRNNLYIIRFSRYLLNL